MKNELAKLRCLHQFLCDRHKSIFAEFECGYDEEKNEYVAPQTRRSSSSQTDPKAMEKRGETKKRKSG